MKKLYGWQDGEFWFISRFKKDAKRVANKYASQNEAIQEAEARGMTIEWLQ